MIGRETPRRYGPRTMCAGRALALAAFAHLAKSPGRSWRLSWESWLSTMCSNA